MIINQAHAQDATTTTPATAPVSDVMMTTATVGAIPPITPPPPMDSTTGLLWNVGFIAVMVVMFYLLLIRPQQKRMQEQNAMIKALKKGDKIVLQSGMIATIDGIPTDGPEMTVAFVDGHKAIILRSAIAGTYESIVRKPGAK